MATITLRRIESISRDPWLRAVAADYTLPEGHASVFVGWGLHDERIAFWIHPDGSGFGAVDGDPEGYVKSSKAMSEERFDDATHPGVDEWEFEPGQFDPLAETIEFDARSSLF